MNKINIIFLLFFICSSFNPLIGQVKTGGINDSLSINNEYNFMFNSPSAKLLYSTKMPLLYFNLSKLYLLQFEDTSIPQLSNTIENYRIRKEINQSLNIYRQGLNKNDLGFVGKVLGYTNAAAALGLAIYHVTKYPKKYGLK